MNTAPHSARPGIWNVILMALPTLGVLFLSVLIAVQFSWVVQALAKQVGGGSMMLLIVLGAIIIPGTTIFFVGLLYRATNDGDDLFIVSASFSSLCLGLVLATGFFLERTSFDNIGMYGWWRLSDVESVINKAREENPTALEHRDNHVFIKAIEDPTAKNIRLAYIYANSTLSGSDYRNAMAAAAIIGLDNTQGYQQALARGWLWKSEKKSWEVHLRKHPPPMDKAPETMLSAYLMLTNSAIEEE